MSGAITPGSSEDLSSRLCSFLQRTHNARSVRIDDFRLLTGGASRQTWSFDAVIEHADGKSEMLSLVLRMDPRTEAGQMSRETEFALLKAAHEEGVPVAKVRLMGDESLGAPGFLMERVEGETIARKLLRDEEYADARQVMTGQLGAILARIHAIPVAKHSLDALPTPLPGKSPAETEVDRFEATYRAITPEPHPALELAFRWLRQNMPPAPVEPTLVHGDYRIGNVIFGPEGVRAILDWELAHLGDPMEDLGWICVRSWRFGNDDRPVGGLGPRGELWASYEAAGGRKVDREAVRWWEVFGSLRWGIICIGQARRAMESPPKEGHAGSHLELLTIGRRTAETEWELLNLMEEA
ncbi:MAG: phosphotransferase family protein [Chloroflexi bacterium]|nr:MAG: phosphotransferase family protein [Chloroflexota bacterium]